MDPRLLLVLVSLCGSGLQAAASQQLSADRPSEFPGELKDLLPAAAAPGDVRLVGGASRCSGGLQVRLEGRWAAVNQAGSWRLGAAAAVCRALGCGAAVSLSRARHVPASPWIRDSFRSGSLFLLSQQPRQELLITCSDSVRLVNGTSLCSGRLEVKSDQSNQSNQSWSSVCEAAFDQQDAEVVCRELGCGAPLVLQGALYGEGEAPMWTKEFQCGGDESSLLDCRSSDRNSCSPGRAVGLTCSEPGELRLVGGASRCAGALEVRRQDEWKPVDGGWSLKAAGAVCEQLGCGSASAAARRQEASGREKLGARAQCKEASPIKCLREKMFTYSVLQITCSDSVRLVNGTSLCSGRLEVKSAQSNQSWSSVCEAAFDQQDAEVVCRELGCGAPSVLQGALYGEGEAPMWTKEFQCGGDESSLLDCRSSDRNSCSPGRAVGLTCSDPDDVRLVGGASRCTGGLELRHGGAWRPVDRVRASVWDLRVTAGLCRRLDCGSSLSAGIKVDSSERPVWWIDSSCVQAGATLRECVATKEESSSSSLEITCSDSVRLVNGTSLCSGRLEVRSAQSNQSWSSVCEAAFDQQDAEVVCRELGCGAPSVLQGALYGEGEAPMWTKEFQCGGDESSLLDCRSSDRNSCSPGRAVGLTCSDPGDLRLVGEASRCAGTLEMRNQGDWRPVADWDSRWNETYAAAACRQLGCGSAVSAEMNVEDFSERLVWWITTSCLQTAAALSECVIITGFNTSYTGLDLVCSDLLTPPNISTSSSADGEQQEQQEQQEVRVLTGSDFTVSCSAEPQYPGGSFLLLFTSSYRAENRTLPAVNHSAHFLLPAAGPAHRGEYRCLYHLHVFFRNFSSESRTLRLAVFDSTAHLMLRLAVVLGGMFVPVLFLHLKATRGQTRARTPR